MSAHSLTLRSESQIQSEMLSSLIAELGINDLNPGSVIDILTQAAASSDFNLMVQIAQVSRLSDINFLNRGDLDLKAFEYGLQRRASFPATGLISILRPEGFQKVSTNFSSSQTTPISGALFIDVNDASDVLYGSSGTLILGRGTNNEETVTYSVAPSNNVGFWRFILDAPLTNTHSTSESVILSQGGTEVILAGTLVRVLASGIQSELQFSLDDDITLLTGEVRVEGVGVTAVVSGAEGNIPSGSITGTDAFPNPPFVGARAENISKFSTGRDLETDDELRDRIRTAGDTLTRGVKQAILNGIIGVVDPDSAKRVVSASVVLPVNECGDVKVFLDDGTGFSPSSEAQGFEVLRENATGGEVRLQLDKFPIQKAEIENNLSETFDMSTAGITLNLQVGILQETITFNLSDFESPPIATAEEIVTAINDKSNLIEARTSSVGQRIVITAKVDTNEAIQVLGGTANATLSFPTNLVETLNLYLDDVKLSKDGVTATLDSQNSSPFNLGVIGAFPHTLTMIIDGKTANTQTATVQLLDVVDPNAVTVDEIVEVLNRDIPGIVTSSIDINSRVRITSNTELSASSRLQITGGTLNDLTEGLNFSTTEILGQNNDYIFNRELGIVELTTPLTLNQTVTGGSLFTRAKLRAVLPELYVVALGETLVVSIDGGADQTITFDGSFVAGQTAGVTASFINLQLNGATAVLRTVGVTNFLEIRTNTYSSLGSIEVKGTSTANPAGFQFPADMPITSDRANSAFLAATNSGPYAFAESDILTVIIDANISENTFPITLSRAQTTSTSTSTTVFGDLALNSIFLVVDEIVDYFIAFTSGANTTSETVTTVVAQGGDIFRLTFNAVPANFGDYVIGDLIKVTGMADPENNGNFVIQALGVMDVDVINTNGIAVGAQTGLGLLSQKRSLVNYNQLTGEVTVGVGFVNVPAISDTFIILPSTVNNLISYMNNLRITPLSLKAVIEGVENNTKLQISSLALGSDGVVEIPNTNGNDKLGFSNIELRGVATYRFWTGLLELVHRTLYGDDTDLVSFPGIIAAGILVRVLAPTVREIKVEVDVTLEDGVTAAVLENEVKSVIASYVNSLGVGDDLVVERIRSAVIQVVGVVDVVIINPLANISSEDNEVIRVKDTNIVVG